jgi:hypothetical protein
VCVQAAAGKRTNRRTAGRQMARCIRGRAGAGAAASAVRRQLPRTGRNAGQPRRPRCRDGLGTPEPGTRCRPRYALRCEAVGWAAAVGSHRSSWEMMRWASRNCVR